MPKKKTKKKRRVTKTETKETRTEAFKRINSPRIDKVLGQMAMIAKSVNPGVKLSESEIENVNNALTAGVKQLVDKLEGDTALTIGFSFDD